MYYAYDLFVKRGPLGTIWLAGNFPRKITKQSILQSNVLLMCESVLNPPVQLALPTQSTLLRGVVRIENKKAMYLLNDATDARNQLRVVVRTSLSLPPKQLQAKLPTISLEEIDPEMVIDPYIDIDAVMAAAAYVGVEDREHVDLSIQRERYREPSLAHVARAEEITLSQVTPTPVTPIAWEEVEGIEPLVLPEIEGLEDISLPPQPVPVTPASVMSEEEYLAATALAVEASPEAEAVRARRAPKIRRFVVDVQTELSDEQVRSQLADTSDIIIERPSLRPPPLLESKRALGMTTIPSAIAAERMPAALLSLFQSACAPDSAAAEEAEAKRAEEAEAPTPIEFAATTEQFEEEWMVSEEQLTGQSALELEVARGRVSDLESVVSRTSFLGMPYDEAADAVSRRVSLLPLEREMPARRRGTISPVPLLHTPDVTVPESQFSVPIEELSIQSEETEVARRAYTGVQISRLTEMFRAILEQQFRDAEIRAGTPDVSLSFDSVVTEAMRGDVTRRDAALAFFQLLVLRTLDIVGVVQDVAYGDIKIEKGQNWGERLSSSQL